VNLYLNVNIALIKIEAAYCELLYFIGQIMIT